MKKYMPDIYSADQLFTFSGLDGETSYFNMLTLLSRPERFSYYVMFPQRRGEIRIPDFSGPLAVGGDFADFGPTRMLLADHCNLLIDGPAEVLDVDPEVYVLERKGKRTLFAVKGFARPDLLDADFEALRKGKEKFLDELADFPEVPDAATGKAVARAWAVMRNCIYAPEGKYKGYYITPDRWPHRACWIMDSLYQAISVRHFHRQAAVDAAFALFAHQQESGRIPMNGNPERECVRVQTQQPIIAAMLKKLEPTVDEIAAAFPHLVKFIDWLYLHRDCDSDGLMEWFTSGSSKDCPCGESGMDNSPRFDTRSTYAAVDLNCFVSRECEVIAEFAGILGNAAEQKRFADRHAELNDKIERHFWNDEIDFYCDRDILYWQPTKVAAVSGFLPLVCGAASPEHAAKLAAHVRNPKTFGTRYPLPSVSVSDPGFEKDMWRGPVWHIFNYWAAEGLDRYGYAAEARLIREKTVEAETRYYCELGGFDEFYDCDGEIPPPLIQRKGSNSQDLKSGLHRAIHDYGWSASIYHDMLRRVLSGK